MDANYFRIGLLAACAAVSGIARAARYAPTMDNKEFRLSTTVERERPELSETTKKLISAYQREPSEAKYKALEEEVRRNYEKVLAKKRAKLDELKRSAGSDKVREMEEIVNEMVAERERRIGQSMARFTDKRMRSRSRAAVDGYHPVMGAGAKVSIAHEPVTIAEYAAFCNATGRTAPTTKAKDDLPVVNVSLKDAEAYCAWLSAKDKSATYRLPTTEEWELAAGHMPKDADFTTVLGACGGANFWGNVWEWTSSLNGGKAIVKGGAWDTPRTYCRTERRDEVRAVQTGYDNVGFRVVRESEADAPHASRRPSEGAHRPLESRRSRENAHEGTRQS